MAKKIDKNETDINQEIITTPIDEIMSQSFGRYSKYVLQERAVPDVRDGLKPVQRRIIYTMTLEGNFSNKPTRKCARTVGAVIGRFHPHGDTSVYEAMVRLSQDWKMRYPLIDFQGNNGSIDGDGAAAYRYTEARLSELSELLVQDLNKDVVDMELNFDDQEWEPVVLPARFPNLLVNGSSGIAVGASTDIPPHNLNEVIDAINYRISHSKCSNEDLLEFIKGPDFPTGGVIKDGESLSEIYKKGTGSFKLYSKAHVEEDKNINQIVIDEIPYGKDKSEFVNNIDRVRFANKLDAIIEVRDETGMEGLKIVIDLKKDSDPENILNFLYSKGCLSTTIKFNMLVIDNYHPKVCSLLEVIDCYINHQMDVLTRRSNYDLNKANSRLHIVTALIRAVSIMDEVVSLIRSSKDKSHAKSRLVNELDFTEIQAEAILMLQLYRLTNLDVTTLINEKNELEKQIDSLMTLLSSPVKMNNLIKSDLNKIKEKFADERRTQIDNEGEVSFVVDKRALISKEEVMIAFTRDGYFKRTQMKSYNSSNSELPGIKQGDVFKGICKALTTDYLLVFTNFGNFLNIPIFYLVDNKWKDEGQHINQIGQLNPNEKIIGGILVSNFRGDVNLALISKTGQIKRTSLSEFNVSKYSRPIKCFRLTEDELVTVKVLDGNTNLLIINSNGNSSYFNENEISVVGIKAGGVKAITSSKERIDIVNVITYKNDERSKIAILTKEKGIRLIDSSHLIKTNRLGPKQQLFKSFKASPQTAIYVEKSSNIDKIYGILENGNLSIIQLDDLKTQPVESFLKPNLDIDSPFNIVDTYHFEVEKIDDTLKVQKIEKPIEVIKKDEIDDYEQLSLFDFVDDD